jgi:phosphohistidine phosphatase
MKTLLLLRHAKSDRSAPVDRDFDRPLNKRGRRAAPEMGKAMAKHGLAPDLALVSAAVRTRQTWDLLAPELTAKPMQVSFRDDLYLAPATRILRALQTIEGDPATILVVGHNPGLEDLAGRLASEEQDKKGLEALERLRNKFPTAALAVFRFDCNAWHEIEPGSGALDLFLTPSRSQD